MQPSGRVSEDEYLTRERASSQRHELINGQVVAMAGGSPRHNAICANVIRALGTALRGRPCAPLTSDQQVHVPATGLFTYPDVTVVCGEVQLHEKDANVLLNPVLIVEVLSPSTEAYDRGAKFRHYKSIPTFREYLLVGSLERIVDHHRRIDERRWESSSYETAGSTIELPVLGAVVAFDEIYEGTEQFPP